MNIHINVKEFDDMVMELHRNNLYNAEYLFLEK